jgi:hypothetical protein
MEEVSEANPGKAKRINKPWITAEVIRSCDLRREKKKKKDLGDEELEEYRKANREVRKMLNAARDKWIQDQTQEIDNSLARQNTKKAYDAVKKLSGKLEDEKKKPSCTIEDANGNHLTKTEEIAQIVQEQ